MAIGSIPRRERLILPRRGAPLEHVFTADTTFPVDTTAYLYFYDTEDEALAFFPLTVSGATITIDVDGEELAEVPNHCGFTVFVTYPSDADKRRPWYQGAAIRST